jgi:hypothetical protein
VIGDLDEQITGSGMRGNVLPAKPVRRHRSTRRRQDTPDLPRRKTTPRTIGKTYEARDGKTFRPSMFITLTCPGYGRVGSDGTPADPARYDYQRAPACTSLPCGQPRWSACAARIAICPRPRGRLTLEKSRPEVNRRWTDTDSAHDERGLKHRATDETRRVPIPPELVAILRAHIDTFGSHRTDGSSAATGATPSPRPPSATCGPRPGPWP